MSAAAHTPTSRRGRRTAEPVADLGAGGRSGARIQATRTGERSDTGRGRHLGSLPFLGLVSALLGVGLLSLLIINNTLAAGSFEQARLKAEQVRLFEQEQALRQDVQRLSSPTRLRAEAKGLGMIAAATTAYIDMTTGKILGTPTAAGTAPADGTTTTDPTTTDPTTTDPTTTDPTTTGTTDPATDPAGDSATTTDGTNGDSAAGDRPSTTGGSAPLGGDPTQPKAGDGAAVSGPATAYDRAIVSGGGR